MKRQMLQLVMLHNIMYKHQRLNNMGRFSFLLSARVKLLLLNIT